MFDNMTRDPEVNLKSLLGSEYAVMNLRPTDKSRFLQKKSENRKPRGSTTTRNDKEKLYFKTLEQNLIQQGDMVKQLRDKRIAKRRLGSNDSLLQSEEDFTLRKKQEQVIGVNDKNMLK